MTLEWRQDENGAWRKELIRAESRVVGDSGRIDFVIEHDGVGDEWLLTRDGMGLCYGTLRECMDAAEVQHRQDQQAVEQSESGMVGHP